MRLTLILGMLFLLASCKRIGIKELNTISENGYINAVIEIPAGSNKKMIYLEDRNTFVQEKKNGVNRVIDYLPYPVNYGFIPKTEMKLESGGDGDALDILVLCQSLATASFWK